MNTNDICNGSASKSNDDGVCEVNDMLQNMKTTDKEDKTANTCANCGKEKECERRVKDEAFFKQPPPEEDCPICFQRLPTLETGSKYMACCGKMVCSGCCYAVEKASTKTIPLCAFCRTPLPTSDEETVERLSKRVEAGDAIAIYKLGNLYARGNHKFPQDYVKALEFWHRAGELGHAAAYYNTGNAYDNGRGVEVDIEKAIQYNILGALGGHTKARCMLGCIEKEAGNMNRAVKHFLITVRDGYSDSLKIIRKMVNIGSATKQDYATALQAYQSYLDDIKSDQRDMAAAAHDKYKYIE